MNRQVPGVQPIRNLSNGFNQQQQQQQQQAPLTQSRSASSRIPGTRMPSNGASWAFGGGIPMGSAGLPNPRPSNPATSFAQTIGGPQPATPLDLSEFPSLSNNSQQQPSSSTPSMWAMPSARNVGQPIGQRSQQQSLLPTQQSQALQQTQQQQDDLFSSSSQLPNSQLGFRFGGQNAVGPQSQPQTGGSDDFPPLSRNMNGDIGQDRAPGLQNVGMGGQSGISTYGIGAGQNIRSNGLLNALSSNSRATGATSQVSSPANIGELSSYGSARDNLRQEPGDFDVDTAFSARQVEQRHNTHERAVTDAATAELSTNSRESHSDQSGFDIHPESGDDGGVEVEDPLPGMSDRDRFGLKGLFNMLKGPYIDQAALISGVDMSSMGFDLNSNERLTDMIWSPFDDAPARPVVPEFTVPDCYHVHNVQPIENKMGNFTDDTLMYMFYSNPQDIQQMIAAQELNNRNWRYHKKLQTWLTKDELLVPQQLGAGSEQGYYIFFDSKQWIRERRQLLLNYADLEPVSNGPPGI